MKEYERLTNEELNDFTSRVVVQLEPTLTQQIISLILELTEYRTKIENGTLIELQNKEENLKGVTKMKDKERYLNCKYLDAGMDGMLCSSLCSTCIEFNGEKCFYYTPKNKLKEKQTNKNILFVNDQLIKRNQELEEALIGMVVQFCQMSKEGYLHHSFMSAEENAFDVLDIKYGEKVDDVYERFNKKWGQENE